MGMRTPIRAGSALAAEFWEHGRSDSCPVYNMHAHMGPYAQMRLPRCEAEDMLRSMDAAGVRLALVSHMASLESADIANSLMPGVVRRYPDRFRAYLTVNPNYPEVAKAELAKFDDMRDVYVGLKFHPDSHKAALTDGRYEYFLKFADERGVLLLSHTYDGSAYNDEKHVRGVLEAYPSISFLMGHCLKSAWHAAADVARDHPNAWLELTGVLGQWGALQIMCEEAGSDRMLFGTDLPWYGHHQGIGHLLCAEITDEDIHNICHRNAERLLREAGVEV